MEMGLGLKSLVRSIPKERFWYTFGCLSGTLFLVVLGSIHPITHPCSSHSSASLFQPLPYLDLLFFSSQKYSQDLNL
jgi:hypothetical protein